MVLAAAAIVAGVEAVRFYDWWEWWGWATGQAALWVSALFASAAVYLGVRTWHESRQP
jgi:hypothetical protein